MGRLTVASVGNLNVDIYLKVPYIPDPDGSVESAETYIGGGGSAANFAVQVAKLGMVARFIGSVGSDEFGGALIRELASLGVDVRWVKRSEGLSGMVVVLVEPNGVKRMIAHRGANLNLSPMDINGDSLNGVNHLHLATGRLDLIRRGVEEAKALGITVSVDGGSSLVSNGLEKVLSNIRGVDVWFLNSLEVRRLSGIDNPIEAGSTLSKLSGVGEVVVTMGERGAALLVNGDVKYVEAFKVNPMDTTGAGDTFAASYIFARLIGLDYVERLIFANAASALKVTRRGARSGPTLMEVLEFLKSRGHGGLALDVESRLGN